MHDSLWKDSVSVSRRRSGTKTRFATALLVATMLLGIVVVTNDRVAAHSWTTSTVQTPYSVGPNSLDLDSSNNPHISFYSGDGALQYATRSSGTWTIGMIQDGIFCPGPGQNNSLMVDGADNVHVAYTNYSTDPHVWLKYAIKVSGSWSKANVYKPSDADVGYYNSIWVDGSGNPHISFYDKTNGDLMYVSKVSGTWQTPERVYSTGDVGAYGSLAIDGSNGPHISFYDKTNHRLLYTNKGGGSWANPTVVDSGGDVGQYTSIKVNSAGTVGIGYWDVTNKNLKFAQMTASGWTTEVVASAPGAANSLALDSAGLPRISFSYGSGSAALKYAEWGNSPPNKPSTPYGPTTGYRSTSYTYSTSATDSEADNVKYTFDWGDGTPQTTTGFYASGTAGSASHSWTALGSYCVKAKATDVHGYGSVWSDCLTVTIVNRAPDTPSTPSGPTSGQKGVAYTYSATATDLDGDNVKYTFDWGDGTPPTTTGFYASGTAGSASHSWTLGGTYCVKAKATDVYGAESGWSSCLTVTIASDFVSEGGVEWTQTGDTVIHSAFAADVNGDGYTDIITAGEAYVGPPTRRMGQLKIFNGTTLAVEASDLWAPNTSEAVFLGVYAGDINNTGVVEIFVVGWAGSFANPNPILCNYTWTNGVLTRICRTRVVPGIWYSVHAANVVGDARLELFVAGQLFDNGTSQGDLLVIAATGLGGSTTWTSGQDTAAYGVYATDVNQDGTVEILTVGYTRATTSSPKQGQLRIWTYGTPFAFTESVWSDPNGGSVEAYSVFAADVNIDTTVDILTCGYYHDGSPMVNKNEGELRMYHDVGGLSLVNYARWLDTNGQGNQCNGVYAANLNQDSNLEIVTGGWSSLAASNYGELKMWSYSLTVLATKQWRDLFGGGSGDTMVNSVYAKDVDGDGIVEVVSGGQVYMSLQWYAQLRTWYDP